MIVLVYPFIFTGEELRYDYGFPHAEWRRNPQAPGTKSNIDNIEAADSKNKISRNVDEPFITVTRKKKLETLFKQSGPEKEKPGDSEKRISSTTQRKGKESEVPVKEVSNLYPNLSAKNLTFPLQPVPLQSCNESNNIEIQNAADTVEKPPNTLHNNAGDTEQRISTKSSQNQSSKVEKSKTTDTEEKALNPLRKEGDTELRISTKSSQNQSSKVEKNKTTDTEEKALNPLRKEGDTEPRISTKSSQNQSSKVEKNKTTDTEERRGGTEPRISTKSSQNQSSKVEKNKTTDTEEKAPNPLRKDGDTEPRISTKSSQNQSSKVEKNKTTDTEEKAPNPLRKDGDTEPRISTKSSQNKSSKNEKNKTTDTEEKAPNPLRKDGDTEPRISTKSSQNQSSNVEKNKTTDTEAKASKQPRKPKNVTRSIEASYVKMTELEGRKPKTPFGAKNECIIPQKVSTISLITRLRFEITDFLKNLFLVAFAPQSENNLMAFMHLIH